MSPDSNQVVVTSGHDVVWNESALVIDEILAVVAEARGPIEPIRLGDIGGRGLPTSTRQA